METTRPNREPDVQGRDMRVGTGTKPHTKGKPAILYDLLLPSAKMPAEWVIPANSKFEKPPWFKDGVDFVAWSVDRGNAHKSDYDWEWVEEASVYYESIQSPMARRIKKNKILDEHKSKFNDLFEVIKTKSDSDSLFELGQLHIMYSEMYAIAHSAIAHPDVDIVGPL